LENSGEDWQVKQAEQALWLYTYFVSRYGKRPELTTDEGKQWNAIIEKMIKVMRLKHLSLNTEKTYTGWSRQFQGFVNGKTSNVFDRQAKSDSPGLNHYHGRNLTEFKIGTSVQLINTPPEAYPSSTT
jgi:hypothetical protein